MKRVLPILLLLILLCGCANGDTPEQTGEGTSQTTQAASVSTYIPNSEVEQQTNGAVRQYDLGNQTIHWIAPINDGVLLVTEGEQSALTVLSGKDGTIVATATIPVKLSKDSVWQTTGGFAYYDSGSRQMVFLDSQLSEGKHLQLPEEIIGHPAVAQDGSEVFYCAGQTVYALETDLKITRPVRTNTCEEQTLLGCYLSSKVLGCSIRDAQGQWNTLYISGEDGKALHTDNGITGLDFSGEDYFATRMDGTVKQYLFGTGENTPQQLNIGDTEVLSAIALGGVVSHTLDGENVKLSFYDLSTGKKTAAVSIEQKYQPVMAAADSSTGGVWLLTEDGVLLYWSPDASAITEETIYAGRVYTAQAPDTEGLAACQERADAMGKELGVAIRIWERALVSNDAYDIEVEYQCDAIHAALDELEAQLKRFPSKFLYKSVAGMIRVCIVRSIGGEITSAYHWYDGDPFIILSVGVDMEQAFMDAFAYVLDIHILGNSSMADGWETLNPEGFTYGTETTVTAYLEGESRAFADRRAMRSVTDDRASIFYHAMLADNADVFQSETMQSKLLLLCRAIRDAWRLENKPETYPWEQYLNQSLAYQG